MQKLLFEVAFIAFKAGEVVLKYYGKDEFSLKDDKSPITQADLESNAFITQSLQEISPFKLCSEEATLSYKERENLEYYWLIDPLDGTKDFIAKNGGFTINIALIAKNRPILGVVYAPAFHQLFVALKGFGAFSFDENLLKNSSINASILAQNAKKLSGDRAVKGDKIIACDSIFHSTKETQAFLQKYNLEVQKYGSSLKICALASGLADLYPRFNGTSEWDIAACDIILQEAGGVIMDCVSKKPMIYNKESFKNNHFIAFAKSQINGKIYNDFLES